MVRHDQAERHLGDPALSPLQAGSAGLAGRTPGCGDVPRDGQTGDWSDE